MEENKTNAAPAVAKKFCQHCGAEIDADVIVCTKCGKQVGELHQSVQQPQILINNANTNTNMGGMPYPYKSKTVALVLAIFLGMFGIHRFYVGKGGTGIIWLCTAGLFGIGWVADIVMIAIGGFRDKARMPLR